jgi:DNA-binding MarR family transcriptional regulator
MEDRGLEHAVRRLISRASKLKHRRMHALLGQLGLHRGEPFVLHALWGRDGMAQSELARELSRSPSTITKTVQRMEKVGLVERRPDARDERVSHVYLTEVGREIRPAVEGVWRELNEELLRGFSVDEVALFHSFLLRVCRNIEAQS